MEQMHRMMTLVDVHYAAEAEFMLVQRPMQALTRTLQILASKGLAAWIPGSSGG